MQKMIELKLTKCTLYLTEQELNSLLAQDPALWEAAIRRGKAFKRHEQALQRNININKRTDTGIKPDKT